MARLTGHQVTVQEWEHQWGREGVWCRACRRSTPVAMLAVAGRDAELACESCSRVVLRGESWLAEVGRATPRQRRPQPALID